MIINILFIFFLILLSLLRIIESITLDTLLIASGVIVVIIGWAVTHHQTLKAQAEEHKKEILYETYKDFIDSIDKYSYELIDLAVHLQSAKNALIFKSFGTEQEQFSKWQEQVTEKGTSLSITKFVQRWESFEIFFQDYNKMKEVITKRTNAINEKIMQEVLFKTVDIQNEREFNEFQDKLNSIAEELIELSAGYLWDVKKELQNGLFRKTYGLKKLPKREPEDHSKQVLTKDGLKPTE